ncbi:MAG: hypothetical protein ACYCVX_13640 [Thiobacillus sp.]
MMPDWVLWSYYLTGGPVLALLALWGLRQLAMAKRDLDLSRESIQVAQEDLARRIQSERTRLAVDMVIRFSDRVLPLIDEAYKSLRCSPLPAPQTDCDPWLVSSYSHTQVTGIGAAPRIKKVVAALNAMEAIAIPFAQDAADPDLAYDSIGLTFVEAASNFAFVVAALSSQNRCSFPATRTLSTMWGEDFAAGGEVKGIRLLIKA